MTAEHPTDLAYNPQLPLSQALLLPRIAIESTMPVIDGGQFAAKAVAGQDVTVTSKVFADGHDKLDVHILWRVLKDRSEECRVGQECVSQCISVLSQYH